MLNVFVGYDPREAIAYAVCCDSIARYAKRPVSIVPLALNSLSGIFTETHQDASTEFAYSRWLVPYLSDFVGESLYIDGDMVLKADIGELCDQLKGDLWSAVKVVKHDYTPKLRVKFRGSKQTAYPKKNWSSVMLFRNSSGFCRQLTPEYVEKATGAHLHQFEWLPEDRVGDLALEWNWLVGEYENNPDAKLLHYTNGIPAYESFASGDHSKDWWDAYIHHQTAQ
jgi:hypothetical protein